MAKQKIVRAKCAIYAQVSTRDKQETLNQLAQLREFCQGQGWLVITEYIDHETGSISTRAEFQRMLLRASPRKVDVLLFWALDRLTREGTLATLQYLERLTSYQVGYRSFHGTVPGFLRHVQRGGDFLAGDQISRVWHGKL